MIRPFQLPQVSFRSGKPDLKGLPLFVVGIPEITESRPPVFQEGAQPLEDVIHRGDFKGRAMEIATVYPPMKEPERLMAIGLGDPAKLEVHLFRRWASQAGREAARLGLKAITLRLPDEVGPEVVAAAAQGAVLGCHYDHPKKTQGGVETIVIHAVDGNQEAVEAGMALAEATLYARMLVDEPPNTLTPEALAEAVRAFEADGVKVRVLEGDDLEREGLKALSAVGQGSVNKPRFIVAEYEGGDDNAPKIGLVGKGITFDSGGLSLKSADRMMHMKYDMAGSAAVLGAFRSAVRLKLPIRITAVVPAAENMPSDIAYRPGDVIGSYKRLTIEVDNTDAEGRLVLADGLAWIEKTQKPDEIIDAATLTGACRIALGRHAAGLFSNDDAFAARLMQSGRYSGERVWQLPLWDEYDQELESDVANMKNVGKAGPGGGASVAASFLRRFVDDTPWAHLDIAGLAWANSPTDLSRPGPSGFGASLILTYLIERSGRGGS